MGKGPTGSVEQRFGLTAVGLYGLSLSLASLYKYSKGRIGGGGGGFIRGSRRHTLTPQGDIMSLVKQVTGHFLQTERMGGGGTVN